MEQALKLRTANHDLRGEKALFKVVSHEEDQSESVALIETGENQYMLDLSEGERRVKVSSDDAKKVDGRFVKEFIHLKYAMKKTQEGECRNLFTLTMRGETEKVCRGERKRAAKAEMLINGLKREFKLK